MDVGDVRAEQTEIIELLDHPEASGHVAHPDVHADGHANVPGKLPVVPDDLGHAEPGTAGAHGEGHEPVVGGEIPVPHAADVLGSLKDAVEPPVGERGVRVAVAVHGPRAELREGPDRLVGVVGRVVDVRPVEERRHAGVYRLERAEKVAGVHVLRAEGRRQGVEDQREVPVERDVRRDAADHGLPGVPVRVDEARDDDRTRGVDDLAV